MKYKIILALAIITTVSVSAYAAIKNLTPEAVSTSSIFPTSGSITGGQKITITGTDLPSNSHTTDYVTDGLVGFYDGIDNTGSGDDYHSTDTTTWKNLSTQLGKPSTYPDALICNNRDCSTQGVTSQLSWSDKGLNFNGQTTSQWGKLAPWNQARYCPTTQPVTDRRSDEWGN